MRSKHLVLLIPAAMFLCDCDKGTAVSSTADQGKIYQSLRVRYDDEIKTMSWEAQFNLVDLNGLSLELTGASSITINSKPMYKSSIEDRGTVYTLSERMEFSDAPQVFVFTDTNGNAFTNSIAVVPISIPDDLTGFSKGSGLTVTWTGDAINEGSVELFLSSLGAKTVTVTEVGAKSVGFPSSDLSAIATGEAMCALIRRSNNRDLTEKTSVGGTINFEYWTARKKITVDD
jgi:hypothetical protein